MTEIASASVSDKGRGGIGSRLWDLLGRRPEIFTLLLIIVTCLVVIGANPDFLQMSNIVDILRASVVRGLFAMGVLVVLASGGIDVSFTAIAAFVMYALTMLVTNWFPEMPMTITLILAALGGAAFGALNGLLVQKLQAPSLIVTIGTQYVIRSFLLTFVGTALFMNIPAAMDAFGKASLFTHHASNGVVSVLPATVLVLVAAALVTWFILERTLMGRAIFAVGGNPGIAERLGINLFRVRIFVFAYAGLLAGIAGVVHVSSNRLANPFDLAGMELEIIAAVVLGGARITGGSGSVIGTLLGVLLITIVSNVLIFVGIPSTLQLAIVGIFILLAGTIFALRNRS
ncbi:ABC transporter permease [Brucella intermedia]|uniref:Monosaccharide-transporting ATPase n=4 Tax=Brucella TaxID=234 RepID=C4WQ52_9HYPH|nr:MULTISPECIES: ABC transporter permease [Brucella/Ochrobactrum group]KAB2669963.1 ABC transporter permease [Ochrobactrum sp. LMG 5442]NKC28771.1 ABC transporter permease [Brucella ciceri]PJT25018.1 ABC transporter permease [Ochrobactrum sp. 30A/1000/2015]PJT40468.1 ABC transporter permease [Ochrobactrum sp. 27A/999/2015]PJT42898.1 ABC transporter permease [Ochrobactrum sp. 23A/997/2015]HCH71827.1 ABC transporter permease [Ochrobactrum sp.]